MMCKLRKVMFKLGRYEFDPEATPEEQKRLEECSKDRQGYFHRWVDDIDMSKDIPYVKTKGLVEDSEDNSLFKVEIENIHFIDKIE